MKIPQGGRGGEEQSAHEAGDTKQQDETMIDHGMGEEMAEEENENRRGARRRRTKSGGVRGRAHLLALVCITDKVVTLYTMAMSQILIFSLSCLAISSVRAVTTFSSSGVRLPLAFSLFTLEQWQW